MLGETIPFGRSLEELGFLPGNLEPEIDFGLWWSVLSFVCLIQRKGASVKSLFCSFLVTFLSELNDTENINGTIGCRA